MQLPQLRPSLGLEVKGGRYYILIPRTDEAPTTHSQIFTTVTDNQREVTIKILEGESPEAAKNKLLGEFDLTGIRPAPVGEPQVEVVFTIDGQHVLNVAARDRDTGKLKHIIIREF